MGLIAGPAPLTFLGLSGLAESQPLWITDVWQHVWGTLGIILLASCSAGGEAGWQP